MAEDGGVTETEVAEEAEGTGQHHKRRNEATEFTIDDGRSRQRPSAGLRPGLEVVRGAGYKCEFLSQRTCIRRLARPPAARSAARRTLRMRPSFCGSL
jgi:hypothetical protein